MIRTLHERLSEVLCPFLAGALSLSSDAVYAGRRGAAVRRAVDVAIVHTGQTSLARGGPDQTTEHLHEARILVRALPEGKRTGATQRATLDRYAAGIVAALDGMRPFAASLSDVRHHRAEITSLDEDPDDAGALEGVVLIRTYTNGDGSEAVMPAAGGMTP